MKFRSAIALLLILVLLLAGCGTPKAEDASTLPSDGETVQNNPEESEDLPENNTESSTEASTETSTEETVASDDQEKKLALGTFEDGVYENTYVGYGCTLGEGWTYMTAEELQDISELTQQLMEDTEIGELNSNLTTITDMLANHEETFASINVVYTYLTPQERLAQALMTEEGLLDSTLAMKDTLIASYKQMGMDITTMEKVTVNFLGEERYAIYTAGSIQGINCYLLQLFDFHLGSYYVTLTFSSYMEDATSDMLDLFYPLD